jgi:hypothetical protein
MTDPARAVATAADPPGFAKAANLRHLAHGKGLAMEPHVTLGRRPGQCSFNRSAFHRKPPFSQRRDSSPADNATPHLYANYAGIQISSDGTAGPAKAVLVRVYIEKGNVRVQDIAQALPMDKEILWLTALEPQFHAYPVTRGTPLRTDSALNPHLLSHEKISG